VFRWFREWLPGIRIRWCPDGPRALFAAQFFILEFQFDLRHLEFMDQTPGVLEPEGLQEPSPRFRRISSAFRRKPRSGCGNPVARSSGWGYSWATHFETVFLSLPHGGDVSRIPSSNDSGRNLLSETRLQSSVFMSQGELLLPQKASWKKPGHPGPKPHLERFAEARRTETLARPDWERKRICPLEVVRHAFVANLLNVGTPLRAVMAVPGHSNFNTTLRYHHIFPHDLRGKIHGLPYSRVAALRMPPHWPCLHLLQIPRLPMRRSNILAN